MPKYILILVLVSLLAACTSAPAATPTSEAAATSEVEPTVTTTPLIGDTTPVVPVATSTVPFDALFINTMTALHQNALALAQVGLASAEHEELRTYAQTIIDTQGAQIADMESWRSTWYADLSADTTMLTNLTAVQIQEDASPFDMRFINALIDQHRVSVAIAQLAQTQAEHEELRTLATQIVTDYNTAITQLEAWRQTWFEVSG